jgi:hypothetical protein
MFESRCFSLSLSLSLPSSLSSYIFAFPLQKIKERFNQVLKRTFFFPPTSPFYFSLSLSLWCGAQGLGFRFRVLGVLGV